jgi:hypothetical protein
MQRESSQRLLEGKLSAQELVKSLIKPEAIIVELGFECFVYIYIKQFTVHAKT